MAESGALPRTIVALEAAGASCSVAVWHGGEVLAEETRPMQRGQSEQLVPMVGRSMQRAQITWDTLDAIAVTNGPGGFTGVRIGLAAAQGLALAWDLPVVTVSCFDAFRASLAADELEDRWLLLLIEAKRAEVYLQLFDPQGRLCLGPVLMGEDAILRALPDQPLILAGDAAATRLTSLHNAGYRACVSRAPQHLSATLVARLAAGRPLPSRPWPLPEPIYLRGADTTLAKAKA